jgi:hypothetical protein
VPNIKKIRGLNLPGTPWTTSACCGRPLPFAFVGLLIKCKYFFNARIRNILKSAHQLGAVSKPKNSSLDPVARREPNEEKTKILSRVFFFGLRFVLLAEGTILDSCYEFWE